MSSDDTNQQETPSLTEPTDATDQAAAPEIPPHVPKYPKKESKVKLLSFIFLLAFILGDIGLFFFDAGIGFGLMQHLANSGVAWGLGIATIYTTTPDFIGLFRNLRHPPLDPITHEPIKRSLLILDFIQISGAFLSITACVFIVLTKSPLIVPLLNAATLTALGTASAILLPLALTIQILGFINQYRKLKREYNDPSLTPEEKEAFAVKLQNTRALIVCYIIAAIFMTIAITLPVFGIGSIMLSITALSIVAVTLISYVVYLLARTPILSLVHKIASSITQLLKRSKTPVPNPEQKKPSPAKEATLATTNKTAAPAVPSPAAAKMEKNGNQPPVPSTANHPASTLVSVVIPPPLPQTSASLHDEKPINTQAASSASTTAHTAETLQQHKLSPEYENFSKVFDAIISKATNLSIMQLQNSSNPIVREHTQQEFAEVIEKIKSSRQGQIEEFRKHFISMCIEDKENAPTHEKHVIHILTDACSRLAAHIITLNTGEEKELAIKEAEFLNITPSTK